MTRFLMQPFPPLPPLYEPAGILSRTHFEVAAHSNPSTMHTGLHITLFLGLALPLALAQSSPTMSLSVSQWKSMITTSVPTVTMAWDNQAVAATTAFSSLHSAMQAPITPVATESGRMVSDGSLVSTSETNIMREMSGMSSAASRSAVSELNMTGAAGRTSADIGIGGERIGLAMVGLSVGMAAMLGVL
ncbi:hypothetical protein J1614_006689 [Plenodomus biglobosus]|nr:hypothetical protein J1614_006689 [Plenodomus biglobosus]